MRRTILYAFISLMLALSSKGQEKYTCEMGMVSDNDATIEGGMFSNTSPVTFDVEPLQFSIESGISGSYKNLNAGYSVTFQTKNAKNNLVKNHIYASIYLACRF